MINYGGTVGQYDNSYRIDASEHIPHKLGRCTESAQDSDSSDGLSIQGVQRRTGDGICR